ncbi:MAG: hypothetical protein M0Z58_09430 [Nitrospiraceae bacterium]|nr:hypothetical protein [Nitrospiraceae bacterium]
MLIPVIYSDDECRLTEVGKLNELIAAGIAKRFLRLDGWVEADTKAIRSRGALDYKGRERRQGFRLYDDRLDDSSLLCDET